MKGQSKSLINNQSGMVAFVVTSFIIIMMSLLVLAFSQNTRREQRQALDRQLSTQAYYTAESAVNETIKLIKDDTTDTYATKKDNCEPVVLSGVEKLGGQDTDGTFKYTCVKWDKYPAKLVFQELNDQGKVISLNTKDNNLSKLKITWEDVSRDTKDADSIGTCDPANNTFQPTTSYACKIGVLRASIFPFSGDRASLIDRTYTAFLRPQGGTGTVGFAPHVDGPPSQGNVVGSVCNGKTCSVTIKDLPTGNQFLMLKSIYRKSNITIEGFAFDGTTPVRFSDGQIEIDVTARASDIVKRVKVAVPKGHYGRPGYSIEAMEGICKMLEVWPNGSSSGGCTL